MAGGKGGVEVGERGVPGWRGDLVCLDDGDVVVGGGSRETAERLPGSRASAAVLLAVRARQGRGEEAAVAREGGLDGVGGVALQAVLRDDDAVVALHEFPPDADLVGDVVPPLVADRPSTATWKPSRPDWPRSR